MESRKVKVNVNGLDININVNCEGQGKTSLLMVHGIPTNACLWRHVQPILSRGYATYAMDMVGYGESDMPLDQFEHSLSNQAEAIKGVIEALDLEGKVILVGHDHGGGACQIMASKYCGHISRLVLINPVAYDYWPVLEVEAFNALVGASDETLQQMMPQIAASLPNLLRTGSFGKEVFTDKVVKEHYLRFWARDGLHGLKSLVKVCSQPGNKETLGVDHSNITCPTMVCWALNDAWMPRDAAIRLKADIAGPVRLELIPEAGHYVLEDKPETITAYLHDFVTEWEGVSL